MAPPRTQGWITQSVKWTLTMARDAKHGDDYGKKLLAVALIITLEGLTQAFAVIGTIARCRQSA